MAREDSGVVIESVGLDALDTSGSILQSEFWARFKSHFGWEPLALRIGRTTQSIQTVLTLTRRLPGFKFCYVPHAPVLAQVDIDSGFAELCSAIYRNHPLRPDLVRFDFAFDASTHQSPGDLGFSRSPVPVQPPDTVVLDLALNEEALLGGMKSKTRYNVRLAERRGVSVRRASIDELPKWYEIYVTTARRDRIVIHSFDYYHTLLELAQNDTSVAILLLFAEVDGSLVAGNIVAIYGSTGYYLFGASSNDHRNLMPTYALQWEGIRNSRASGCSAYDLWGIPPDDNENHKMHGLYRMKVGFGGNIIHRAGAWDILGRSFKARLYRKIELLRNFYFRNR